MSPAADGARSRAAPGIPSAFSESAAVRSLLHTGLLEQFGRKFLAAGYEGSAPVIRPGSSARFGDAGPRRPRCPAAPLRPAGRCVGLRASRCRRTGATREVRVSTSSSASAAIGVRQLPSNAVSRARSAATGHRCRGSAGGRAARAPAHPGPAFDADRALGHRRQHLRRLQPRPDRPGPGASARLARARWRRAPRHRAWPDECRHCRGTA